MPIPIICAYGTVGNSRSPQERSPLRIVICAPLPSGASPRTILENELEYRYAGAYNPLPRSQPEAPWEKRPPPYFAPPFRGLKPRPPKSKFFISERPRLEAPKLFGIPTRPVIAIDLWLDWTARRGMIIFMQQALSLPPENREVTSRSIFRIKNRGGFFANSFKNYWELRVCYSFGLCGLFCVEQAQ
jgi:hypothetical protein